MMNKEVKELFFDNIISILGDKDLISFFNLTDNIHKSNSIRDYFNNTNFDLLSRLLLTYNYKYKICKIFPKINFKRKYYECITIIYMKNIFPNEILMNISFYIFSQFFKIYYENIIENEFHRRKVNFDKTLKEEKDYIQHKNKYLNNCSFGASCCGSILGQKTRSCLTTSKYRYDNLNDLRIRNPFVKHDQHTINSNYYDTNINPFRREINPHYKNDSELGTGLGINLNNPHYEFDKNSNYYYDTNINPFRRENINRIDSYNSYNNSFEHFSPFR